MADRDDARALVDDFENSARTGMWTGIRKADIVEGLRERISNSSLVYQAGSPLCGPAVFTYELATDDPVAYAKAVIDLFTGGPAVIGTLLLKPKTDLIFNPFTGGVDPADWVMMASLRDSSNWFFDMESVDDYVGAATIPSTMASWLQTVGFSKVINQTNLWYAKDSSSLMRASSYLTQEYRVLLFINSAMVHAKTQTNLSWRRIIGSCCLRQLRSTVQG